MEKFIAMMQLFIRLWPAIQAILEAITNPVEKKKAEAHVVQVIRTILDDVTQA